jgi:hypothetical protein
MTSKMRGREAAVQSIMLDNPILLKLFNLSNVKLELTLCFKPRNLKNPGTQPSLKLLEITWVQRFPKTLSLGSKKH